MTSAARTWTFLTALMLFIVVGGHASGGREGLLWGVGLALAINSLIYLYPDIRLKYLFKGQSLEGVDPWGVHAKLLLLSERARIPLPQVKVLKTSSPQAMVMGRSAGTAQILLTQGLIDDLEPDELESVLAYLVACIKRQDVVGLTVAAAILDFTLSISRVLDSALRVLLGASSKRGSLQSHFFSTLISPLMSLVLRIEVGQANYYQIDKAASEISNNPNALARTLWKLHSFSLTAPVQVPVATAHLWMVSPIHKSDWAEKFRVQPPIDKRIRKLVGYYPI
jgi:heat shock protein HtpX